MADSVVAKRWRCGIGGVAALVAGAAHVVAVRGAVKVMGSAALSLIMGFGFIARTRQVRLAQICWGLLALHAAGHVAVTTGAIGGRSLTHEAAGQAVTFLSWGIILYMVGTFAGERMWPLAGGAMATVLVSIGIGGEWAAVSQALWLTAVGVWMAEPVWRAAGPPDLPR
jgi:hypothetical protein